MSYTLYVAKSSGGVVQQTTTLNNALASWVHECRQVINKCCERTLSSQIMIHCSRLWTAGALFYLPKRIILRDGSWYWVDFEESRHLYCNLIRFLHLLDILRKMYADSCKVCSGCMLYARTASEGNVPFCIMTEKGQVFGIELNRHTVI
jgi:hypothetical protein